MEICSMQMCTGCSACQNKCPVDCIKMQYDSNGFFMPKIDENNCIKCLACIKVCPQNFEGDKNYKSESYKAWSIEDKIRFESSSGGVFTEIAKEIIYNGGIVFGAAFDENFKLVHVSVDNIEDLSKIRGSKYIQSNNTSVYRSVLKYLKDGRRVLYSGTPCQIDGLNRFLGKKYDNLLTVDVLCHGVGSTKVFNDSLSYLSNIYNSSPINVNFRYKRRGYNQSDFKITFKNNKKFSKILYVSPFGYLFAKRYIVRESCLNCIYCSEERRSDITLGDYQNSDILKQKSIDIKRGISIVLINSKKGNSIFNNIKNNIFYENVNIEDTIKSCSTLRPMNELDTDKVRKFFEKYNSKTFKEIIEKEYKVPKLLKFQYFIGRDRFLKIIKFLKIIVRK